MTDPLVRYIEKEFRKGFPVSSIRTTLVSSGHDILQVEAALDHVFRRHLHHQVLFFSTLAVIIVGMLFIQPLLTQDGIGQREGADEITPNSYEHLRLTKILPVPRTEEECLQYILEIERVVCRDKFERLTPVYYPSG
ncbi:MAG: hypothetical protein ABIC95_04475 [archaeon]